MMPFAAQHAIVRAADAQQVLRQADVVSLHMSLTDENRHFINAQRLAKMKDHAMLINSDRVGLVVESAVARPAGPASCWATPPTCWNPSPLRRRIRSSKSTISSLRRTWAAGRLKAWRDRR